MAVVLSQTWLWLLLAGVESGLVLFGAAVGTLSALALFVLAIPMPTHTTGRRRMRK